MNGRRVVAWSISGSTPERVPEVELDLEKDLEDWIEQDPSLVSTGLTIVGRQLHVEGGYIDLLGVDTQGRLTVIEIKRGWTHREALAQALDYAACIGQMDPAVLSKKIEPYLAEHPPRGSLQALEAAVDSGREDREVAILLVGVGRDPGLDRLVAFLGGRTTIPISVVVFDAFRTLGGETLLVRGTEELDSELPHRLGMLSLDEILADADRAGTGEIVRTLYAAGIRHEMYARPFKKCIMLTPPSNRARTLYAVWIDRQEGHAVRIYTSPETFSEFFPVSAERATELLGPEDWQRFTLEEAKRFARNLDVLFEDELRQCRDDSTRS